MHDTFVRAMRQLRRFDCDGSDDDFAIRDKAAEKT